MRNLLKKITIIGLSLSLFACANPSGTDSDNSNTTVTGNFTYEGNDIDKTSQGNNVKTDGSPDLHFKYSHEFANEVEILSINISRYENGKYYQFAGWHTSPENYWVLAVEINGKAVNTGKTDSLGKFSGQTIFDFYGADLASLNLTKAGTKYQMEILTIDSEGNKEKFIKELTI